MPRIPVRIAHRLRATSIGEQIRSQLDLATYVRILHEAALTGQVPVFNVDGTPTGRFDAIDISARIEVARYLVNKGMPDIARVEPATPPDQSHLAANPHAIAELSTEELQRLILPPARVLEPEEAQ
jgi:hypothetical protein